MGKKIGILQNSSYVLKNHLRYYDFLKKEFGEDSLVLISTACFSTRANNFRDHLNMLDQISAFPVLLLEKDNIEDFLYLKIKEFSLLVVHSFNHDLINMLITKFARKCGIPVVSVAFCPDVVDTKNLSQFKRTLALTKWIFYNRFFRQGLRLVWKLDKQLFWYFCFNFFPNSPRKFKTYVPEEYRMDHHFVHDKIAESHVFRLGYTKKTTTIIGPFFRNISREPWPKKYILFIDSDFLFKFIPFDYLLKLQDFYQLQGFDFIYAPHPVSLKNYTIEEWEKIRSGLNHILEVGQVHMLIRDAMIIITAATTLIHTALILNKQLILLESELFLKQESLLLSVHKKINQLAQVPIANSDLGFNPKFWALDSQPKINYQAYIEGFYGDEVDFKRMPQDIILEKIKEFMV